LTITNGNADLGGGILNYNTLIISNCLITGSQASTPSPFGNGGGIENNGPCKIINSTISGNVAATVGGGIENSLHAGTTLSLVNCTIASNVCDGVPGGAIDTASPLYMTNCTIADNRSTVAGGIGGISVFGSPTVLAANSIIADNTASGGASDLSAAGFSSAGFNLIGSTNGSTGFGLPGPHDQAGSTTSPLHPLLGPLQLNGGSTPTMALLAGSPAIDQGKAFGFTTDQRGAPRPYDFASLPNAGGGDGSDIGAFELASPTLDLQPSGGNNILAWPSVYGDFALESTTNLAANDWAAITDAPVTIDLEFVITNHPGDATRFFRLKAK
jgi:hypothetical protein